MKPLCGIDEAGRGPLAGPLVVAGVILPQPIDGLNDSKQLTSKQRDALFETIVHQARWCVVRFDAAAIDDKGISACLRSALTTIMSCFGNDTAYLFDGNSTFGVAGLETMVKADATIPEVSAASILAKVARDREMEALDALYPQYGFASHKGYGTKAHIEAIAAYGRCALHRRSFRIKRIDEPTLF